MRLKPSQIEHYLDSFVNNEHIIHQKKIHGFSLDNIRGLLSLLGNPQNDLKIIHAAGSKGKGSICNTAANILMHAGYKTGLYTSPHINNFRERIRILENKSKKEKNSKDLFGDEISIDSLSEVINSIKWALNKIDNLSYFEVLTAAAFVYFKKEKVDFVVLETGLGGRLDATNVSDSIICVLTPISLEHKNILGNTINKIAAEKAAIIKNKKQKVIISPQEPGVEKLILKRCKNFDIIPVNIKNDFKYKFLKSERGKQIFNVCFWKNNIKKKFSNMKTNLLGPHQIINICTVIAVIEALNDLGVRIKREAIYKGLKNVFLPGRFEFISKKPLIICDAAHNPQSAEMLARTIKNIYPKKKVNLIFGISTDKDLKGFAKYLNPIVKNIIGTKARHPRAREFTIDELKKVFPGKKVVITDSVKNSVKIAIKQISNEDILLITGSFFVVGEARELLKK